MSNELERYKEYSKKQLARWESLCGRCGACCGIGEGDPCEHLAKSREKTYYCRIYENRFGTHQTVSGKSLKCVPIREILHKRWPGDECCGYKKKNIIGFEV